MTLHPVLGLSNVFERTAAAAADNQSAVTYENNYDLVLPRETKLDPVSGAMAINHDLLKNNR